jgi:23S rRNA U2552 (ribose-2'-O)-methylase RlmE/FtsJ
MKYVPHNFEGISILQHPDINRHFEKIINNFDRIIEIGTYAGGLTLYLYRIKKSNCDLISYDIDASLCQVPKEYGIDIRQGNYFTEEIQKELRELISVTPKRVLLLCDGGYKEWEFNTFSEYLKSNDVIMVHDYAESYEEWHSFTDPIEWPSLPDSSYLMIKDSIEKHSLSKHELYQDFKSVLWGIFIKK